MNAQIDFISNATYRLPRGFSLIGAQDIDSIYAWLHNEQYQYLPVRINRLIQCIKELKLLHIPEQTRYRMTEAFISGVIQIAHQLHHYGSGSLDMSARRRMITLCDHAADIYIQIIDNVMPVTDSTCLCSAHAANAAQDLYTGFPIHRALEFMTYCYYECQRWDFPLPDGFWRRAHRLYHIAATQKQQHYRINSTQLMHGVDLSIEHLYTRLLMLSQCEFAQSPRLMHQIYHFCTIASSQLTISEQPETPDSFMIDPDLNIRFTKISKHKKGCYYFNFKVIDHLARKNPHIRHDVSADCLYDLQMRFAS